MLINEALANKTVATGHGHITFDHEGKTEELTAEQRKDLGELPGFTYVEPKKEVKKAPAKTTATKTSAKKE